MNEKGGSAAAQAVCTGAKLLRGCYEGCFAAAGCSLRRPYEPAAAARCPTNRAAATAGSGWPCCPLQQLRLPPPLLHKRRS